MNKIPTEVDQLMWAVAENPLPQALDEFAVRHPQFKLELLKRVEMVKGVRHEIGTGSTARDIPKFKPQPVYASSPPRGIYVAVALGLFAIGFAVLAMVFASHPSPIKAPPPVAIEKPFSSPSVVYNTPPVQPIPPAESPPNASVPETAPPQVELEDQPRNLKVENENLLDAIRLVATGTKYKLEIGPGFVNQKVNLAFRGKNTIEMLQAMAKEFAFTVSDEGDDHLLLIPVPDAQDQRTEGGKVPRHLSP